MNICRFLAGLLICLGLVCFSSNGFAETIPYETIRHQCNNKQFLQIQQQFENSYFHASKENMPVHICGKVIATSYAKRTRSGLHGYFYMNVGSGVSIRIVNNLDEMHAPQWPWVKKGDYVEVAGRYYYDSPRRQGVDWTHKGTGRHWPYAGHVIVNGVKYD